LSDIFIRRVNHAVLGLSSLFELPDIEPMFDIEWKRAGNPDCKLTDFFG